MKKIVYVLANFFLIFFMLIGLAVIFSSLPIKNNFKLYAVTSGSMQPTIPVGALAVSLPEKDYHVGDIITFKPLNAKTKNETVTHRIVKAENHNGEVLFTTKGDANSVADLKPITKKQILGRELFNIALIGYLFGYLRSLPGLFLVIVVPSIIIIYEEVKKLRFEIQEYLKKRRSLILAKEK
jgi:signal peptidase